MASRYISSSVMVAVLLWADEDREPNARIADNKRSPFFMLIC
jgi:hypothetical protein